MKSHTLHKLTPELRQELERMHMEGIEVDGNLSDSQAELKRLGWLDLTATPWERWHHIHELAFKGSGSTRPRKLVSNSTHHFARHSDGYWTRK